MTVHIKLNSTDVECERLLTTIAHRFSKARRSVVVTGAGISCSAGIPDFRSSDGIYNLAKQKHPDAIVKGKDLFDSMLFSDEKSTRVFFSFITALRKQIKQAHSTKIHKLLKQMKYKNRLLRCYTQNIDGLERLENLVVGTGQTDTYKSRTDVIQLHGDIHALKCMHCGALFDWLSDLESALSEGESPECPKCVDVQAERERVGKRCTGIGSLRPNIVLYGEEHPAGEAIGTCTARDLKMSPDCLIVTGTSLKVSGIQKMVRALAKAVKQQNGIVVFVNATGLGKVWNKVFDYHVEGGCDDWVQDLERRIPNYFSVQSDITKYANVPATNGNGKRPLDSISSMLSPPATPRKNKAASETSDQSMKLNLTLAPPSISSSSLQSAPPPIKHTFVQYFPESFVHDYDHPSVFCDEMPFPLTPPEELEVSVNQSKRRKPLTPIVNLNTCHSATGKYW